MNIKRCNINFFPFLLIYPILKKDRVSLHDKIARTKVIARIESKEEDLNKSLDITLVIDSSGSMGWDYLVIMIR